MTVLSAALAVVAGLVGVVLVLGLFIAMAFFIGVVGYGWMRTIAPKEELEALPEGRRRWVTLRAGIGSALLWLVLLSDRTSSRQGRHVTGNQAFAFLYPWLRRFAGLPTAPPAPPAPPARPEPPEAL